MLPRCFLLSNESFFTSALKLGYSSVVPVADLEEYEKAPIADSISDRM